MLLASYSTNSLQNVFKQGDAREVDGNTSSTPSTPSTPYQVEKIHLNITSSYRASPSNAFDLETKPLSTSMSKRKISSHVQKENAVQCTSNPVIHPNPTPSGYKSKSSIKSRNLHIDNLPSISEDKLLEFFSQYGPVLRVRIAAHSIVYTNADYGFVMFEKPEDAKRALVEADGITLPLSMCTNPEEAQLFREKKLCVTIARPKRKFLDLRANTNLYIANLPLDFTHTRLMDIFCKFGSILESRILMDRETGESRGVGFVRYENTHACDRAIQAYHNKIPSFSNSPLTVRYAVDKPINNYPPQMLMNYTNSPTSYDHPSVNTMSMSAFATMLSGNATPINPPLSPSNLIEAVDFRASLTMLQYSSNMMQQQNAYMQNMYLPQIPSLSLSPPMPMSEYNLYSSGHSLL